jgi:hypothetical protein
LTEGFKVRLEYDARPCPRLGALLAIQVLALERPLYCLTDLFLLCAEPFELGVDAVLDVSV